MKNKLTKKLSISKETIAALNIPDMDGLKGGASLGQPSCVTCETLDCCDPDYTHETYCSWVICP